MSDRQGTLLLGALAVGSIIFWMSQKKMSKIVTRKGEKERNSGGAIEGTKEVFNTTSTKVLFATKTGTARLFALELERLLRDGTLEGEEVEVLDLATYHPERLEKERGRLLFICSTWSEGRAPERVQPFFDWVQDYAYDFRVGNDALAHVQFAIFGLGGALYKEDFAKCSKELYEMLTDKLGAHPLVRYARGDDQTDVQLKFRAWSKRVVSAIREGRNGDGVAVAENGEKRAGMPGAFPVVGGDGGIGGAANGSSSSSSGTGAQGRLPRKEYNRKQRELRKALDAGVPAGTEVKEEDLWEEEDRINAKFVDYVVESDSDDDDDAARNSAGASQPQVGTDEEMVDVEDLGNVIQAGKRPQPKGLEMVTTLQRQALTKEGYKIIGTHSAVKLCRWTKHQLRGRGGCYKHTFYGITSYQCMEATPSLACANKCVFCWRHHKNPVGTEWRWKQDPPEQIVNEAIKLHQGMINQMRGVPGVQPERLAEAFTVAHCALSLVGEPIMYPEINKLLSELHKRHISTFMVTNAQFPEQIAALDPVTQLYVSVDASTKESLKAIDRPLFKDFWERFHGSLAALATKQQRTVYRLTLVNGWNMDEAEQYAELIEKHQPDFIEIKAVTYCGKSDGSSLTMQNVPWHREVCNYCEAIAQRLNSRAGANGVRYSIATEHEHSCCVLLAREDKFLVNGRWHTWIDYPKYNQLIMDYYSSEGQSTFTSTDYMAETPSWALYQSQEHGFDPVENRFRRNKQGKLVERDYKASESGCG